MPPTKKKSAATKAREAALRRSIETNEQWQGRLRSLREYASTSRAHESPLQYSDRLSQLSQYAGNTRRRENSTDRVLRLEAMRKYTRDVRQRESPAEHCTRLLSLSDHANVVREQESSTERSQRLRSLCQYAREVREHESSPERSQRLDSLRQHARDVRKRESSSERSQRLCSLRQRAREVRERESSSERSERIGSMLERARDLHNQEEARTLSMLAENNESHHRGENYDHRVNVQYTVFENAQKALKWEICSVCNKSFPNMKVDDSSLCVHCVKHRNQFNIFSVDNNMDPGECPAVLKELTMIEEQLIARVHPVVQIYRIRGQQYAFSGQVINFPQNVSTIATMLPHSLDTLSSVIVVRRQCANNYNDFRINRDRVRRALLFLKSNNEYYKDIDINEENLNAIPENANLTEMLSQDFNENMVLDNDDDNVQNEGVVDTHILDVAPNDQQRMVRRVLGTAENPIIWPEISSNAINEFTTAGYIAMAFPTLFPTGAADLRSPRRKTISHLQYFQYLMQYKDQRFAKHSRFRFFALNSHMRWTALQNSSICIRRNSELSNMSVNELKEKINRDPSLISKLTSFNANLRGTSAYWRSRCGELLDMVGYLGTPTLFFTLSAADLHWPELYHLLEPNVNFSVLDQSRGMKIKNNLLNENPLIVSWFFQQRADFFIKKIMGPHFFIKDFWYRTEFQHRGSPHIHGILWLEGAPDVTDLNSMTIEEKTNIANYFGNLVTTLNPNIGKPIPPIHPCQIHYSDVSNHDDDYENLVNCCQRHTRHGKQCLRINKTTKAQECRFKFPFPLNDMNELVQENGEWTFKSARNDPLINSHNRFVCENWRANTDMQCILSTKAVLNYIAKYASKSEPRSKAFEEMYSLVIDNQNEGRAKEVLRKIFLNLCAERDISAQETFHILMGWPLYHSSRVFVKINVDNDQWLRLNSDPGKVTVTSVLESYPLRPQNFDSMSLKEFFSKHYKRGNSWATRRKPAVPRIVPRRSLNVGSQDDFYKQQVILNIPWRSMTIFTDSGKTWKELYEEHDVGHILMLEIPEIEEEDYEEEHDTESIKEQEEWMILAEMGPNQQNINRTELGMREFDLQAVWDDAYNKYINPGILPSFISEAKSQCGHQTVQYCMPGVNLNEEQNNIILHLNYQIEMIQRGRTVNFTDRCTIIQGKAGSGKSTIIGAMCYKLNEQLGPNSYLLMAPTGVAAVNVGGCTIHSGLHIGIEKSFKGLDGEAASNFQAEMADCNFIILDEMSMIGCSLFHKIDLRCREAKPQNAKMPFGGMCLYLFGDIKQLPPVMDRPFYGKGYTSTHSDQGQLLFKSIARCVILRTAHRQDQQQHVFRGVLDRLSIGQSTLDDWRTLMTREKSQLGNIEISSFENALRLIPFNESVLAYNIDKLGSLNSPVAKITSKNNNSTAAKAETDIAQGLEKNLYLARGSRVMLKSNLWVGKGLVNGALGYVHDIIYEPGSAPPHDMPIVICVAFDKYTGPHINGTVPIPPMTRSWRSGHISCSRTQFPLSLAWAVTVHKSQGLTLDKVVVDIGEKELAAGCTYVALSRSKRLTDVVFDPGFDFVRLEKIKKMKLLHLRIEEEERLERLSSAAVYKGVSERERVTSEID